MTPPTSTPVTPNSRVALVTGANSGIGRVTAVELALRGYHVFLACRDAGKTAEVLDEIAQRSGGKAKAEFIALDLGDLDSVRQCAQAFNARELPLHLLVNNAGLAGQKGFTKSGFELAFGVCHVGHFLLTRLLLDRLKASSAVARRGGGQPGAPPRQGHRLRRRAPAQPQPRRPDGLQRRQAGQHSVRVRIGAPLWRAPA
jgi:NAD(P)-dependent dehydrogenase (short-subunit alcohol dehydrogenase family)